MGIIKDPPRVKLFVGVLSSIPRMIEEAETGLTALFGPVDLRSEVFPFDATRYYDDEMGHPILRRFFGFAELIAPDEIAAIKTAANELEAKIASVNTGVNRPVNLDPGYLEQAKIVLASTKNFYHRILIAGGIYAEVTQHFESGRWCCFPWTFPDFRTGRYDPFFSALRDIYRGQLRNRTLQP